MADTLFIVPFQMWAYGIILNGAVRLWLIDRSLLLAGLMIQVINDWLVSELFGPAISDFTLLSQGLMPAFFTIAVFTMGISYLLAPFFHVRVVKPGKALGWLVFALLFYQAGPGLYIEGESLRRALSAEFYAMTLEQTATAGVATGPIAVLNSVANGPDEALGNLDNQFGAFVPSDQYVDGLDLAMAYILADGDDVVYALSPLPDRFRDAYYDPTQGPLFFLSMSGVARTDSINQELSGISRLIFANVVIIFGLFEQLIYLCLSISAGILFISMAVAVLFSFFERTETIAKTLIDMWIELLVLSAIIGVFQAFTVGLVTLGARTLNPTLTLGASTIGGVIMGVLLFKALNTIWSALNRMFEAMSNTVGGGLTSPADAGRSLASSVAGLGLSVATAGASAAVSLAAGAGMAQVAGSALSGMDTLYSASALGSFILPDESRLKGSAQGFYEGALSNRMMGPLGGLFLGEGGIAGMSGRPSQSPASPTVSEMDVRFDSADLTGLRDAVSSAMNQALLRAPHGGYSTEAEALGAVKDALRTLPQTTYPGGVDPRLGDYVEERSQPIASHVYLTSQGGGPLQQDDVTKPVKREDDHDA